MPQDVRTWYARVKVVKDFRFTVEAESAEEAEEKAFDDVDLYMADDYHIDVEVDEVKKYVE